MYRLFVFIFFFISPSLVFGQLCQKYRQEGITAYNSGNYTLALKKFQGAAKVSDADQCPDLNTWIAKTQKALQPRDTPRKPKPDPDPPSVSYTFVEPKMVRVEGGTFQMGSNDGSSDEKPVHSVSVSTFYIGKYEVTQAEWRSVMGKNPSSFTCSNCAVEEVSWNDIQEFLRKLNAKTDKNYRLPTEAEWEYAAKGGNQSKGYTYSGSNDLKSVAWYDDNTDSKTHPVGGKKANELGVHDMSGNVSEWCSDWYDENYYKNSPVQNPQGAQSGSYRVLRGGSWNDYGQDCRSSYRSADTPGNRSSTLGFRLVFVP